MFKKLNPSKQPPLTISFNGEPVAAYAGDTIATALLAAGHVQFRITAKDGAPRGPYCMMGSCFECIVEIDGEMRRQACLEPIKDGMRVSSVHGADHE